MNQPFSVVLFDGLGNKMFQYAFGLNFSKKHNRFFFISNIYSLSPHSNNLYLEEFFYHVPFYYLPNLQSNMKIEFVSDEYLFKFKEVENQVDYIPIYRGFFQSEKYFLENKDYIIECLTPKIKNEETLKQKYDKLDISYFLHVRRGDYLESKVHHINLENYYKKCLELIGNNHVYLFSNDNDWCKNYFKDYKNIELIEEDEISSMWLMSKCWKGGVCANSTFSWWGGYLNKNPNKKVYFPNKWLNGDDTSYYEDVYPSFAIRIEI